MVWRQTTANPSTVDFEVVLRTAILFFQIEAHESQIDRTGQVVRPLDDITAIDVVRIVRWMVG